MDENEDEIEKKYCEICDTELEITPDGYWCPECCTFIFAIFDEDLN